MKVSRATLYAAIAVALAISLAAPVAHADISYILSAANSGLNGYTAPFGTVTVSLNNLGTTATFSVTGDSTSSFNYLFGGDGMIGLNINAAAFTYIPGPASAAANGAGNEDGFGSFNFTLKNSDGFTDALHSFTFQITNTGGPWASESSVLTPNSGGYNVAAHIFVATSAGTNAGATGYAADDAPPVPEPASIAFFGTGLLTAGFMLRSKLRAHR